MWTPESTILYFTVLNSFIVLVGTALGVYSAHKSRVAASKATEASNKASETAKAVKEVEHKTNSIFDAYLKAVGDARFAAGSDKERKAGEEKAAALVETNKAIAKDKGN